MVFPITPPLPFAILESDTAGSSATLSHRRPLGRFAPATPIPSAKTWLAQINSNPQGAWLIDPFGSAPALGVVAAKAGWRILVAANNPIQRFLLETLANPPARAELKSVLADLASSYKDTERLETHIRSFYLTKCKSCQTPVEVEAFLWEKNQSSEVASSARPYACIYNCVVCGSNGEFPLEPYDFEQIAKLSSGGLHFARALERVAPAGDPDRIHAEEALQVYLPRSVYILFTLINKLDALRLSPQRRNYLAALLLHACDTGSALSGYPVKNEHPRSLTIPARFRENNLWLALEEAVDLFSSDEHLGSNNSENISIVNYPELPDDKGGICVFEGPMRAFLSHQQQAKNFLDFQASLFVVPRPNQAYWTLCALWTGWLWGREAAAPFKNVLRRRRYDWSWHTTALHAAFENLSVLLPAGVPILGLTEENEPGLFSAALTAAYMVGFKLDGLEARNISLHVCWKSGRSSPVNQANSIQRRSAAANSAVRLLQSLGQPASYIRVHMAATAGLIDANLISCENNNPAEIYNMINTTMRDALSYSGGFHRYGAGDSVETGLYWLRDDSQAGEPLADLLEKHIVSRLVKLPDGVLITDIEIDACRIFPGLLTPNHEMILASLNSYAIETPPESGRWILRSEDKPAARRQDLDTMLVLLENLGKSLGFFVEGENPVFWKDNQGLDRYIFYRLVSAVIGPILRKPLSPEITAPVIVVPGGRASLIHDKLNHNPRLAQLAQSWIFLKTRHLRLLTTAGGLTQENLLSRMNDDPLTEPTPQMRFL